MGEYQLQHISGLQWIRRLQAHVLLFSEIRTISKMSIDVLLLVHQCVSYRKGLDSSSYQFSEIKEDDLVYN